MKSIRVYTLACLMTFTLTAVASAATPELVSVRKIWDQGEHNAFTDLIRWQDRLWCVFREGEGHVGGDGRIRVLSSDDAADWESVALLTEEGVDLRDPKLSITPDGRLMLVMGGSVYGGTTTLKSRQPRVSFSSDGKQWTKPQLVLDEGEWLWRVTWHNGMAYGISYRTEPRPDQTHLSADAWSVSLYQSDDGESWQRVTDFTIPGRPNEATLRFRGDEMWALLRREGGEQVSWIGRSLPPYAQWQWRPTSQRIGGPNFVVLPDGTKWAGGRQYEGGPRTVLFRMTDRSLDAVLTFPSGGDTSYPGFVLDGDGMWVSYYSSHEGNSAIYIARVRWRTPGQ